MKTRLLAILLALSLVLSLGVGLNVSAEDTIIPPTTIDFEDGVNPFVAKSALGGSVSEVVSLNSGNKAYTISNQGTLNSMMGSGSTYGRNIHAAGFGIPEANWGANIRPTKVSFKFKIQEITNSRMVFFPVWSLDAQTTSKVNLQNLYSFTLNGADVTSGTIINGGQGNIYVSTRDQGMESILTETIGEDTITYPNMVVTKDDSVWNVNGVGTTANNATEFSYTYINAEDHHASTRTYFKATGANAYGDSVENDIWNNLTCEYDWSEFTAEKGYLLGLTFTIETAEKNIVVKEKVKKDSKDAKILSETQGFSFGFATNTNNAFCVDDIAVESYDCVTGATYAPETDEPEVDYNPVINGATIKREGSQDLRFNCEFGDIREDKEVAEYGLILTFKQYIDNGDVTADDMVADSTNEYVRVIKSTDVSNVAKGNEFYANVGNIYPEAYGYRYSARVYVKYADETTIDYSEVLDRSVISVAKAMSKFAYEKQLAGVGDIVSAVDGDSVTWTYDPNTDNGVTILNWIQTNQQAIVDAYNAANQ